MVVSTLFDDDELEGKYLQYNKNRLFKKKKKITSSLIDICVISHSYPFMQNSKHGGNQSHYKK